MIVGRTAARGACACTIAAIVTTTYGAVHHHRNTAPGVAAAHIVPLRAARSCKLQAAAGPAAGPQPGRAARDGAPASLALPHITPRCCCCCCCCCSSSARRPPPPPQPPSAADPHRAPHPYAAKDRPSPGRGAAPPLPGPPRVIVVFLTRAQGRAPGGDEPAAAAAAAAAPGVAGEAVASKRGTATGWRGSRRRACCRPLVNGPSVHIVDGVFQNDKAGSRSAQATS